MVMTTLYWIALLGLSLLLLCGLLVVYGKVNVAVLVVW